MSTNSRVPERVTLFSDDIDYLLELLKETESSWGVQFAEHKKKAEERLVRLRTCLTSGRQKL